MVWFHAVAERDHLIQNPSSPEKIRELGARLGLGAGSHVLDMACGKCGPAVELAREFGCRITGVEKAPVFAEAGRERVAVAGLSGLVEVHEADGAAFPLGSEEYDAALCLGASWIWDGLEGTLAALSACVRAGGHVVVGEPYWRRPPPADHPNGPEDFVSLAETVGRFEAAGLAVGALIDASLDDWDRYESMQWQAVEGWLTENPGHPEGAKLHELSEQYKQLYLRWNRELLGWVILAGRKA